MQTEHDEKQDARIAANAEAIKANADAIRRQTEYLHEIRNYFIPEEEARFKRFAKYVVTPLVKIIALVAFIGGLWDVIAWVMARHEVKVMADRYVEVAKDIYYNENNPEVAVQFLDKAIALRDGDAEYRFQRAYIEGMAATRLLLNLDRPFLTRELDSVHHAYAEARFLQELKPDRPEPYILQAQVLVALKDAERAETNLVHALKLDPKNDFVHLRMAVLQLARKDVEGAEKSLDRALELNPKSKWAWLWKGVLANDCRKDKAAARACYEKALELDPRFDMALYNIGATWGYGKEKDYAKAREFMQKALRINPDYKEACYQIGMFYGYEDNYPVAKVWMDKAIAIDGNFLTAYKGRGIINGEMNNYEDAVRDFNAAILLDPMNADLYVRRAKQSENLGRLDDALRDLRFAYDLKPDAVRTLLYLGNVYVKAGQGKQALDYYDRAIAAQPTYDDAYARKADTLAGMGREADALAAVEKAIEVSTYKPERFWLKKGELLEKLKRPADARAAYVKARTLNPKLLAAWKKEMELARAAGDAAAADAAKAKCLELDPTARP